MPIYEYECTSCGERFEIKQKVSDPPIKTCDQLSCSKAQPVNKVISAPAIMFKGTGWYVTDYSDKLKEPGSKSENKGKPSDVTSSEKPSEGSPSTSSSDGGSGPSSSTSSSSTTSSSSSSSSPSSPGASTGSTSGSTPSATNTS